MTTVITCHLWRSGDDMHGRDRVMVFVSRQAAEAWLADEGFAIATWANATLHTREHGWLNRAKLELAEVRP